MKNEDDSSEFRINKLSLANFRGVREHEFELGQVTLLTGRNGLGKTTVFDAIDWALFGSEWRLGKGGQEACAPLTGTGRPRVELSFEGRTLVREGEDAALDGHQFDLASLVVDPEVFRGARDIPATLRRLMYLPQESLRELATGPSEWRAFLLGSLAGVPHASLFKRNAKRTFDDIQQRANERRAGLELFQRREEELGELIEQERRKQASIQATLERARAVLGASPVSPAQELISLVDARCRDAASIRASLDGERQRLQERFDRRMEHDNRKGLVSAERTRLRESVANLESESETLQTTARERLNALPTLEAKALSAEEEIHLADSEAQALRREARVASFTRSLLSEFDALRLQMTSLDQSVAASEHVLLEACARHERASKEVDECTQQLEHATGQRAYWTAMNTLQTTLRSVQEHEARTISLINAHKGCRSLLEEARRSAATSADHIGRLASLLGEMAELQPSSATKCPMCAHEFGRPEALRQAFADARFALNVAARSASELVKLENEVRAAADAEREASDVLAALRRESSNSSIALEAARVRVGENIGTAQLAELGITDFGKRREAALRDLTLALEAVSQARSQRDYYSIQRDACKSRLQAIKEQLAESDCVSSASETVARVEESLKQAERRLEAARRAWDDARTTLRNAQLASSQVGAALRNAQAGLTESRLELAATESRLERVFDEERRLLADTDANSRLGHEDLERINQQLAEVSEQASTLFLLRRELEAIAGSRLGQLEAEREDLKRAANAKAAELRSLERAATRLEGVRAAVEKRVAEAAAGAVAGCGGAVEQVLRLLSPNSHLTAIDLEESGDLSLRDAVLGERKVVPALFSSSGQLNCLGLALFFGLSLRQRLVRMPLLLLDEPVQNLDDVHFLNFFELIRRVARRFQVVVSTADKNIAELWKRKLAVWSARYGAKVVCYRFVDFDIERGPEIRKEVFGSRALVGMG